MSLVDSLSESLDRLTKECHPSHQSELFAEPITGYEWARLGVNRNSVVVLLPASNSVGFPRQDLEHITIDPAANYRVSVDGQSRVECISCIATKGRDGWLVATFLQLTAMLLQSIRSTNPEMVQVFVNDLVSLFRALTQPANRTAQGLWGELFLIRQSSDVELLVSAWHDAPNDRYDFAFGRERLEAKTTTGPRIHTFGHLQLANVPGLEVHVASMVLLPSSDGLNCAELAMQISERISNPSLRNLFTKQVIKSLGRDWRSQAGVRFDFDHAVNALRFFNVTGIPKISGQIPAEVTGISYQSDLQTTKEIELDSIETTVRLLRAVINA